MKRTCLLACAVALVTLCSCTVKEQRLGYDDATGGVVLTALTDMPGVRTGVVDGGTEVFWESQEEIKVFAGTSSAKFVSANTDLASKADFIGPSDFSVAPGKPVVAVYPYSDDVAYDGECITMTLPSEQVACPGTFARGTNIAVAKSDTHTLQFRNVCGGLRFSVKEEGITKVIFEGLGGEIISGKITVAFEDGLPVVRSVSNGSPFITLQAPEGQTLEVGKWYYIVALPGALDKGYKLRFYKDDTYARRVSDCSVSVKRSMFGSVVAADSDSEYVPVVTHFPETEEEIATSIEMTQETSSLVWDLLKGFNSSETDIDEEHIVSKLQASEHVLSAKSNNDGSAIIAQQRDGVWINILMENQEVVPDESSDSVAEVYMNKNKLNSVILTPAGQKALILAPFQFQFNTPLDVMERYLKSAGFIVEKYENDQADFSKFNGSYLSQFDFIFIFSHGLADGMTATGNAKESFMTTGLRLTSERFLKYASSSSFISVPNQGDYLGFDTGILDNASFNDSFVLLSSCSSSGFAQAFYKKGAKLSLGFSEELKGELANSYFPSIVSYLACGNAFLPSHYDYLELLRTSDSLNNRIYYSFMLNYCKMYSDNLNGLYLFDPTPKNLSSQFAGNGIILTWYCHLSGGDLSYYVTINDQKYEVPQCFGEQGSFFFDTFTSGSYEWSVTAVNYLGEEFTCAGTPFTIEGSEPVMNGEVIDLGLSVDWCTCNLGAASPEEYGDYYAWGENETKSYFDFSNYKWGAWTTLAKYCVSSSNGNVDNKTVLEPEDDVASVKLGADWRIPTVEEWEELKANCSCQWCDMNGVVGAKLTSLKNGNYIFFPAGGDKYENVWADAGKTIRYWASSLRTEDSTCAWGYWAAGNSLNKEYSSRCYGRSIRPVSSRQSTGKSELVITPSSLNFGEVVVGSSKGNEAGRVTMTNTGSSNLVISSFDCPSGFSHSPNLALPHTIAPGDSWTVTFAFRPTSAKQYSGYIKINSNASNGSVSQVRVTGTGISDSKPYISISPASLNFGEVAVGSSRGNEAGRVTMTNTGSSNLVISSFDCPSGFSHSPNLALPHTIAPGDSWTVTFAFRPTSAKQYSGYISINSNASNGSVKQVKVSGTGI